MPKVLAIFGAGPGLSRSVPHRFGRAALERLDPDDLAQTYWDMYVKRDRFEVTAGSFGR